MTPEVEADSSTGCDPAESTNFRGKDNKRDKAKRQQQRSFAKFFAPSQATQPEVKCPICQAKFSERVINAHIDECCSGPTVLGAAEGAAADEGHANPPAESIPESARSNSVLPIHAKSSEKAPLPAPVPPEPALQGAWKTKERRLRLRKILEQLERAVRRRRLRKEDC
ncbi:hypothetical protein CYMTET_45814 [Cymbomonas tetramitiformis]|uniref:UBZ4-type domain-containing protein n=1 Tax=Cymbomonas tetramitiformis TaxID=36881 RepID=A0AAE0BXF7_9CHLO|nr:hypothetical protein CYMTET_45814 [Cymbomonas tetramitiformis]